MLFSLSPLEMAVDNLAMKASTSDKQALSLVLGLALSGVDEAFLPRAVAP